jgi:type III pantothenate kinase
MNLVIDIGNTHTKLAWFDLGGRLKDIARFEKNDQSDMHSLVKKRAVNHAIVSSVGSTENNIIVNLKTPQGKLIYLDHQTPLPIAVNYRTQETLGHDRIAAAAGARQFYPNTNVLIIDMGTAITIDFLSFDGRFLGGNISPGLTTRFKALNAFTAKLPLVSKDDGFPPFGTDTRTAIVAGVQQGIIYEIDRYIEEYTRQYPGCEFIITGGDADFFVSKLKRPIFVMPELVLSGLNFILEFNTTGKKQ